MFLEPITGMMMSELFSSVLQFGATTTVREIHLSFAYWGFLLLSIHAGMHLGTILQKLKNRIGSKGMTTIGVLATAVSAYGIYAFIKREFWSYMTLKTQFVFFDLEEPLSYFFVDYLAIMALFTFIGYLIMKRDIK